MFEDDPLEQELQEQVSRDELMANNHEIARFVRLSGSEEEADSVDYIQQKLEEYGLETTLLHHESYVSWPGPASLRVLSPEIYDVEVITHAFGASTEGLEGELVYVGAGRPEDYEKVDARGKIALCEGLVNPGKARAAEQAGAIAHMHIHDQNFHEMIVSWVWGTPTADTADELPSLPVLGLKEPDGERLKALLEKGPVRVRMSAEVSTRWRTLPLLVAELEAPDSPDFVLLSGHIDSWHYGAMDNGSANATMIEVARLLAPHRDELRRGLRLAFWSGHSHGRYSGSTWYADNSWDELEEYCVCHVNVDSTGGMNANILTEANVMAETRDLAAHAIEPLVGEEFVGTRQSRAGDQSFWGVGLPSLFMSLSQQEAAQQSKAAATMRDLLGAGRRGGGLGWWWHTVHDTMDKIDPDNLVRDTKVYVSVIWRLCTEPVLPLDYRATVDELTDALKGYQAKAGEHFDLSAPIEELEALASKLDRLYDLADEYGEDESDAAVINWTIMQLGRSLVPIGFTVNGRFDHDFALPVRPVPGLAPAADLADMDPDGNQYRFTQTGLVRQRNRVVYGVREAHSVVEQALEMLGEDEF